MNIAILASGNGSNFEAMARASKKGKLRGAKIKLLITDKEKAYVRIRAKKYNIKDIFVDPKKFKERCDFEKDIVKILKKEKIKIVVLAGFMKILTPYFVRKFKNRILNIHPALLPAFSGTHAIERAYKYGVKITGVTVHFVDEKVDHGPIILQEALRVKEGESLEELEERIHHLEHKLYPKAIKLYCKNKLKPKKRSVSIA